MSEAEDQDKKVEEPEAEDVAAEQPVPEDVAAEQPVPEASAEAAEAPAAATAGGDEPPADAAATAEEEERLTPKQQRKLRRSRASGAQAPQRSAEERATERAQTRARKAAERSRWRRKRRERDRAERPTTPPTAPEPRTRGARKVRRGIVVSAKPDKTITVRIDIVRQHPRYGKIVRNTSTLHVHDESNQANEGDVVRVVETRRLSRTKRWRLLEVVERAR